MARPDFVVESHVDKGSSTVAVHDQIQTIPQPALLEANLRDADFLHCHLNHYSKKYQSPSVSQTPAVMMTGLG
jgi:hypothetical protein